MSLDKGLVILVKIPLVLEEVLLFFRSLRSFWLSLKKVLVVPQSFSGLRRGSLGF